MKPRDAYPMDCPIGDCEFIAEEKLNLMIHLNRNHTENEADAAAGLAAIEEFAARLGVKLAR